MTRRVDYRPLLDPISAAEVADYRTRARAAGIGATASTQLVIAIVVGVVVGIPIALSAATTVIAVVFALIESGLGPLAPVVVLLAIGGLVATIVLIVRASVRFGGRWERWARLERFARANGLVFSPQSANPNYPGSIFGLGSPRQVIEHLRSADGRFFDFGTYRYTTGSGKSRSTHSWGFLALHLERRLPHIVLDARRNNGFFGTNLPATFDKSQVLSLEGDFDRYFTLYCPKEYEIDALSILTPDLMALLIDEAAPFDVELVDDWMFVYRSGGFVSADPNTIARLFRIIDTVGSKTVDQTARYRDERVANALVANRVAPPGQRLKRGVSIFAIVLVALFALIWLSGPIQGLIAVIAALFGG